MRLLFISFLFFSSQSFSMTPVQEKQIKNYTDTLYKRIMASKNIKDFIDNNMKTINVVDRQTLLDGLRGYEMEEVTPSYHKPGQILLKVQEIFVLLEVELDPRGELIFKMNRQTLDLVKAQNMSALLEMVEARVPKPPAPKSLKKKHAFSDLILPRAEAVAPIAVAVGVGSAAATLIAGAVVLIWQWDSCQTLTRMDQEFCRTADKQEAEYLKQKFYGSAQKLNETEILCTDRKGHEPCKNVQFIKDLKKYSDLFADKFSGLGAGLVSECRNDFNNVKACLQKRLESGVKRNPAFLSGSDKVEKYFKMDSKAVPQAAASISR